MLHDTAGKRVASLCPTTVRSCPGPTHQPSHRSDDRLVHHFLSAHISAHKNYKEFIFLTKNVQNTENFTVHVWQETSLVGDRLCILTKHQIARTKKTKIKAVPFSNKLTSNVS
jgi:hypothetical protein